MGVERKEAKDMGEAPEARGEGRNEWKQQEVRPPVKAWNGLSQEQQTLKVQRWGWEGILNIPSQHRGEH